MCVAKNTLRGESVFSPIYGRKSAGRSESYFVKKGYALFDKLFKGRPAKPDAPCFQKIRRFLKKGLAKRKGIGYNIPVLKNMHL